MSAEVTRTLAIPWRQAETYLSGSGSVDISFTFGGHDCVATQKILAGSSGYATLKDSAKSILYPNAIAHPLYVSIATRVNTSSGTQHIYLQFDGTEVASTSVTSSTKAWEAISDADAVKASTIDSVIRFFFYKSVGPSNNMEDSLTIDLAFTQYDFAASAGTGIASATVDKSTGFDGDTITFTATMEDGYAFEGWYNGDTLISTDASYAHTANGADLTLTARGKVRIIYDVIATYNGVTKTIYASVSSTYSVYVKYWGNEKIVNRGTECVIGATDKIMHSSVDIELRSAREGRAYSFLCAEKMLHSPIRIQYKQRSNSNES